jgi:hypothetical protein
MLAITSHLGNKKTSSHHEISIHTLNNGENQNGRATSYTAGEKCKTVLPKVKQTAII